MAVFVVMGFHSRSIEDILVLKSALIAADHINVTVEVVSTYYNIPCRAPIIEM